MKWLAVLVLVVAGAVAAQTPTITPNAAQDCCTAYNINTGGQPGCDDSTCEQCVCYGVGAVGGLPDGVCCFSVWDFQCSQEALGLQGTINCAAQCACARVFTPTPVPRPTDTPLITGQCLVNTPMPGGPQIDEDTPTPAPTDTPGGPTQTATETPTATGTVTASPVPTFVCPCFDTITGIIYRPDGTVDRNDTVTFVGQITHPVVLGGCTVSPVPPVSTTTNANGVMKPIKLPCGLPVNVTLAHGGGSPVQTYVPFLSTVDFADMLAITTLGRTFP